VLLLPGANGKITPGQIEHMVKRRTDIHYPKPRAVSLTQATEVGTVYPLDELGAIGDMATHNLDPAVWALDLNAPVSIEASTTVVDSEVVSPGSIFRYQFGPRGDMPPVKLTWYDGGLRPERPAELEDDEVLAGGSNGVLFIGDKGAIMCAGWGGAPRLIPTARMETYKRPPQSLPRSNGHHRDWLDACKGGRPASSNFEYGARLTEIVLLGTVALRTGKKLNWDHENMKATNAPKADRFIKGQYRKGWEVG